MKLPIVAALRAQAASLTALADAIEAETVRAPESVSWTPLRQTGVPLRTLRGAIRRGELRATKLGREHCVSSTDLAAWIETQVVAPRSEPETTAAPGDDIDRQIEAALSRGRLRAVPGGGR